jgi:hypothetical protein
MRSRSWARLVLAAAITAAVAAALFGYIAGSAPAGNRNPTLSFAADPGPSAITFGKTVAYKAKLVNDTKSNFKNVTFAQTVPSVTLTDGTTLPATLVYSSCAPVPSSPPAVTGPSYACPTIDTLPAGSDPVPYTLVWQSQGLPQGKTCASPCQLSTVGTWSIKEANPGSNDTFPTTVNTTMLTVPDPSKAGTYAITACSGTSDPTLLTNQSLNATTNPASTSVCVRSVPGQKYDPGLDVTVNEFDEPASPQSGFTQISQICIADTGVACPNDSKPYNFGNGDNRPTFVFVYDNTAYRSKGPITKMFRELHPPEVTQDTWVPVSSNPADDTYCLVVPDTANKITTATCRSPHNSHWRGG